MLKTENKRNMVKTIQQIKHDLTTLEDNVTKVAVELRSLYSQYLDRLNLSVQKQLILASYQICTQAYPESFLRLSLNQRQQLQHNLRQIGKKIQPQLFFQDDSSPSPSESPQPQDTNFVESIVGQITVTTEQEKEMKQSLFEELGLEQSNPIEQKEEESLAKTEEKKLQFKTLIKDQLETITHPDDLFQWQKQLEGAINQTLEKISNDANSLLQQTQILPHKLPPKFLEVAIQAEEKNSAISGPPNLLNLLVETDTESKSEDSTITQITTIHLRCSEVEFSDPFLSTKRNQIRHLLAKINTIRQQYQRKMRDLAIAEAEAAWRSSWIED